MMYTYFLHLLASIINRRKFRSQLPTLWADEKQSRAEAERRERLEEEKSRKRKSQKKEDADARKGRKVAKHCVFPMICGSEDPKVGSLKRRVRSQLARWEMKNCTPLWHEAHFQVKMYKAHQVRTTFGSWAVEKVHAVVARSTFPSQNVQNTPGADHFWQLSCRKSAHRFGAKHISKSKCAKHTRCGSLLAVELSKKCTPLWREAHFEVKMLKTPGVRTTFGGSDVASLPFTTLHYITLHYTTLHYTTLQLHNYTPLHSTTLNYTTLHYITATLHSTTLPSTTLHYATLHYLPLHYTTLHYLPLHFSTLHYTTLHYTTTTTITTTTTATTQLHSTTLHYITLHYITLHYTAVPSTTLHYITLHYTPVHYKYNYQLHNYTPLQSTTLHYITLHYITLHYTTLPSTTLHYTTLHSTTLQLQLHNYTHYTPLTPLHHGMAHPPPPLPPPLLNYI